MKHKIKPIVVSLIVSVFLVLAVFSIHRWSTSTHPLYMNNQRISKLNSLERKMENHYTLQPEQNHLLQSNNLHSPQHLLETYGLSFLPSPNKFRIFLIWIGETFPSLYMSAFETILFHHPHAQVMVLSNELDEHVFDSFKKFKQSLNESSQPKYQDIHVVRFNLTAMTREGKLGSDFVQDALSIAKRSSHSQDSSFLKLTRVHLSDFLRYYMLYYYGGLYIDSDMFVMRNLQHLKNAIGVDGFRTQVCHSEVYSKGPVKDFACLCNCLMSFEKEHPFMREALENYGYFWRTIQGYGPGGAVMLMKFVKRHLDSLSVYHNGQFLCNDYLQRYEMHASSGTSQEVQEIIDNCHVAHLYGGGKNSLQINLHGTNVMSRIYEKFKIS
ncbi:hypothetical protein C9374_014521 [Naegleria lovaniensis]|uniref:Uncharacterized protein n=1 Tax=Naegleria lovaniensis TaxID=51637 RepID=A0AA88GZZ1_NAELO|nr:uncharacterized protein C9374_014521 [Naegleria lovaniensis]KAG2389121.1 hypothetical protein C9374_014521 [Naegleria lovaniensis]